MRPASKVLCWTPAGYSGLVVRRLSVSILFCVRLFIWITFTDLGTIHQNKHLLYISNWLEGRKELLNERTWCSKLLTMNWQLPLKVVLHMQAKTSSQCWLLCLQPAKHQLSRNSYLFVASVQPMSNNAYNQNTYTTELHNHHSTFFHYLLGVTHMRTPLFEDNQVIQQLQPWKSLK